VVKTLILYVYYAVRHGRLGYYLARASRVEGWTHTREAIALAQAAHRLPDGAEIVEIGSFLGRSSILLAGARKLRRSGRVHCVDPFDSSGDSFSVPVYQQILSGDTRSQRKRFDDNLAGAGVSAYVDVHQGTAESVAAAWTRPIDMLFLDGDQSPKGARSAYDVWAPFLKVGGTIALHNSSDRRYDEGHDGYRRVVVESLVAPHYSDVECVGTTTFARKTGAGR
jgi:predicted O-methyltransferase YrrM